MDLFQIELEKIQHLIENNQLEKAVFEYNDILRQIDEHDDILLNIITKDLGFLYYELNQFDYAIECLLTALNQNFDDESGRINKLLGFSYAKQNQFEYAVEYLEEALYLNLEENDEYFITKFELAKAYLENEEREICISHMKAVESYFSEDQKNEYYGSSLYYLGLAYLQLETFDLADEYFTLLLNEETFSNNHVAHGYYGKLFLAKAEKNAERMIEYAGKLMELIPDFYDRETIMYFTVLAYQYQNRQQEYETALKFFMAEYPHGKYSDQYDDLKEYEFKIIEL